MGADVFCLQLRAAEPHNKGRTENKSFKGSHEGAPTDHNGRLYLTKCLYEVKHKFHLILRVLALLIGGCVRPSCENITTGHTLRGTSRKRQTGGRIFRELSSPTTRHV